MRRLLPLALLMLGTTSCVLYLDNPTRCTVQGRVVQAGGQPVSNAVVCLTAHRRHMSLFTEQPVNLAGTAVTDSNGVFAISGKMTFPATVNVTAKPLVAHLELDRAPTNAVLLQAKPAGRSLEWRGR